MRLLRIMLAIGASLAALGGGEACSLLVSTDDLSGTDAAGPSDASTDPSVAEGSVDGAGGGGDAGTEGSTPSDSAAPDNYYDAVMSDRPIAYFRFAEATGAACKNEISGSPISALYPSSGVAKGAPGAISAPGQSAVQLLALDAMISVFGPLDFPGSAPFTFEAWVKFDEIASTTRVVADMANPSGPRTGWWLFLDPSAPPALKFHSEMWAGDADIQLYTLHHTPVVASHFYHLVYYHSDKDHLIVDGQTSEDGVVAPGPRRDNGVPLAWGGFKGTLDEFAVYDKALQLERVAAHYVAR